MLVDDSELHEVAMCLLEVIPGNLLELDRPVTVHAVTPRDEALVERRTRTFQETLVDAVANQDVLEPEGGIVGQDELFPGQLGEPAVDLLADEVLDEVV